MIDEKNLIEKIQKHSKDVGDKITNPFMKAGYKLAHEHIVDIIHLLQTQTISAGTINCGHTIHPVIPPLKPVVLCKDCDWTLRSELGTLHCVEKKGLFRKVNENEFCSFGKRKD